MTYTLPAAQRDTLLQTLQTRFKSTMSYHPDTTWDTVLTKLSETPGALETLHAMETSGGMPNVVTDPEHPSQIVFMGLRAGKARMGGATCATITTRCCPARNSPRKTARSPWLNPWGLNC